MKFDRCSFEERGYAVVDLGFADRMAAARRQFIDVFAMVAAFKSLAPIGTASDVIRLYHEQRSAWSTVFAALSRLPVVQSLASEPRILELVQACQLTVPALSQHVFVRADMTSDAERQGLGLHQDYPSGRCSHDSVTIWLPYQDTDESLGCLEVWPGSHAERTIWPNSDLSRLFPDEKVLRVPMRVGEALVFNQYLVHRSGLNTVDDIRFSAQVRFTNLDDAEYASRGYAFNFNMRPVEIADTGLEPIGAKSRIPLKS
jgi:ectoine hydroxylase-related dioxygenase (phytanoyl-CoA dioxygenase family)